MGFQILDLNPDKFEVEESSEIWNNEFPFQEGKKYHIHAASGKGKSSFFRFICGLDYGYSGSIKFNNEDLKRIPLDRLCDFRKTDWSLVFQNLALFPELTLKQNLEVYTYDEQSEKLLDRLGLGSKIEERVQNLSYGERQRTAIIRALNKNYQFLIMDEPFSHLDSELRNTALEMIFSDVERKKASLILLDLEKDDSGYYDEELSL